MTDSSLEAWSSELRNLLDLIQSRPSTDWTVERERIVVLNHLIATRKTKTDA